MPTLNGLWQFHLMLLKLPVGLFVFGDIEQQGLAAWPLKKVEVSFKVGGELYSSIVCEVGVQSLDDAVECTISFKFFDAPVLEQPPGHTSEGTDDVEDRFTLSFGEGHLPLVKMDPLPPFAVVSGLTAERGDIVVSQVGEDCPFLSVGAGGLRRLLLCWRHRNEELLSVVLVGRGDVVAVDMNQAKTDDGK